MSLLIPSIVNPNPIQPSNNCLFRWIKPVKSASCPPPSSHWSSSSSLARAWRQNKLFIREKTRGAATRRKMERGGGEEKRGRELIDRGRGRGWWYSTCSRTSTVLGLIINVARGLILASQSLIEACRVRTSPTLFRMLMTHVLRLLVIMLSIMWIMETYIYVLEGESLEGRMSRGISFSWEIALYHSIGWNVS